MAKLGRTVEQPRAVNDRRGQVDVWPILALDPVALAAEIERGDHDGYLDDLRAQDRAQYAGRAAVQDAIRKRMG